jgi:hypothetical protein
LREFRKSCVFDKLYFFQIGKFLYFCFFKRAWSLQHCKNKLYWSKIFRFKIFGREILNRKPSWFFFKAGFLKNWVEKSIQIFFTKTQRASNIFSIIFLHSYGVSSFFKTQIQKIQDSIRIKIYLQKSIEWKILLKKSLFSQCSSVVPFVIPYAIDGRGLSDMTFLIDFWLLNTIPLEFRQKNPRWRGY